MVHGVRNMHATWDAETSGGGWQVAVVGKVQVDDVPRW